MRKETKTSKLKFGSLVAALYDEAIRTTSNKSLQTSLVCLALLDLRRHYKSIPYLRNQK